MEVQYSLLTWNDGTKIYSITRGVCDAEFVGMPVPGFWGGGGIDHRWTIDKVEEAIELFLSRVNFKKNVGDHFEWVLIRVYEPNFDIDRSFCGRI